MRTCSHLGSEPKCRFLGQGGCRCDYRCSGSATRDVTGVDPASGPGRAVTGWTLQRHGEQKGRAQASKMKLRLGKMKPKQSEQSVVAASFPLSQSLPELSSTSTRPLLRSQPLQIQLQILPGRLPSHFPESLFTVLYRSLTTLWRGQEFPLWH